VKLAGLLLAGVVGMATVAVVAHHMLSASHLTTTSISCHRVQGPFSVRDGYTVTARGDRYTPCGIAVTGIRPGDSPGRFAADITGTEAQEDAAATFWGANTVRFGVDQDVLTSKGKRAAAYLSAVEKVVKHAEKDGLAVVLSMSRGRKYGEPMPTSRTLAAWQTLVQQYGSDPRVIYDVWNEPQLVTWQQWRDGGTLDGHAFYGMEAMARELRGIGARNLLWVQGILKGTTLRQIPVFHLTSVGPVTYAFHHPLGPHTPGNWTSRFGFLAGHFPVVDGEWTNYSRSNAPWACWPDARTSVPAYLSYLAGRGVGLVAFDLAQPRLLQSASLTDPTTIKGDWACRTGLNQGAGQQILTWFKQHNR
jgi:Cellulase (glycosyl hydrolase family 5)